MKETSNLLPLSTTFNEQHPNLGIKTKRHGILVLITTILLIFLIFISNPSESTNNIDVDGNNNHINDKFDIPSLLGYSKSSLSSSYAILKDNQNDKTIIPLKDLSSHDTNFTILAYAQFDDAIDANSWSHLTLEMPPQSNESKENNDNVVEKSY